MPVVLPDGAPRPSDRDADVIDALMVIDDELVEWLLLACPTCEEEKEAMKRVLALRTQLSQQLNQLVLERMKLAAAGLEPEITRLNKVTAQVVALSKSIGTMKEVIHAADEAVGLAAQALAVIAMI